MTSLAETFRNTIAIAHIPILAHLPLALQSRDGKAEPDDASQHNLYVGPGRICCHPWRGFIALLLSGEFAHVTVQPLLLFHDLRTTIGMDDRIIPCRNDLPMLNLRRIPVGRNVTLGPLEDHQRLAALSQILPMRIGTREMAFNHSVWSIVFEQGRQMSGIEPGRARGHERDRKSVV